MDFRYFKSIAEMWRLQELRFHSYPRATAATDIKGKKKVNNY